MNVLKMRLFHKNHKRFIRTLAASLCLTWGLTICTYGAPTGPDASENTILLPVTAELTGIGESGDVSQSAAVSQTGGTPLTPAADPNALFGGGQLMLLQNQQDAQMLSAVIYSREGGLVVVDGGWDTDAEYLTKVIQDHGGHVNAWLVTHPHSDHVGALYSILKKENTEAGSSGITIDHIYESFAPLEWYQQVSPDDSVMVSLLLEEQAKLPEGVVCSGLGKGDQIQVDGITITVVNDPLFGDSDPVNNSSLVYRLEMNGVRIMFLGDLGYLGGCMLLRNTSSEDLKADIVQVAHHGQNGVGLPVYQAIGARICLWPTPLWLWDNDNGGGQGSGPWQTLTTRRWMDLLHVESNYGIMNGDVILN